MQIHSRFHGIYLFYPVLSIHVVFDNLFCMNRALGLKAGSHRKDYEKIKLKIG